MHFTTLFLPSLLALSSVVLANPAPKEWDGSDGRHPRYHCITDKEAALIVSNFESFFIKLDTTLAEKTLAKDFQEFSDSINYVTPSASKVPGAVTAASRAEFIASELAQQVNQTGAGYNNLNIWHTCDEVIFRWQLLMTPIAIGGIDVLVLKPGSYLIQTDYSEFNNVGLLADFGCKFTGGLCGTGG